MIIDGCRFCNIEETDNSHSRWQSFQFRFNSSAEIVCNQLNFNRKILVFSRILAEFFSTRDNSDNPNIRRIFPSHPHFFRIADWGSMHRSRDDNVLEILGAIGLVGQNWGVEESREAGVFLSSKRDDFSATSQRTIFTKLATTR